MSPRLRQAPGELPAFDNGEGLASLDDDRAIITDAQLTSFQLLQRDPGKYTQRVVEHLSFLPGGGESWRREVQVRLPPSPDGKQLPDQDKAWFLISLGSFRRRRFADFTVTGEGDARCHLVTRPQHAHCLAVGLLQKFLSSEEWDVIGNSPDALNRLSQLAAHLESMITAIPGTRRCTARGAQKRIRYLLAVPEINATPERINNAALMVEQECEKIAAQTQYLCWVYATPGSVVRLTATYTQSEQPHIRDEPESTVTPRGPRLSFRNWRMLIYARLNVFPLHVINQTPAPSQCGSYYFMVTPPEDTRALLVDWGTGYRFGRPRPRPEALDEAGNRPGEGQPPEIDSGRPAFHSHAASVSQSDMEAYFQGARVHTFLRSIPYDNAKIITIGLLGICLAWAAQRGALVSQPTGALQWLWLGPAALVLFIAQQQRHHYASLTTPFRMLVWCYVLLSMLFAASSIFDSAALGASPTEVGVGVRILSGAFAVASGVVVFVFYWSSSRFDIATERSYKRVLRRIRWYGTPSLWFARKGQLRAPKRPVISAAQLKVARRQHPSDRVYSSIARHSIDRAIAGGTLGIICAAMLMVLSGWGERQSCAVERPYAVTRAKHEHQKLGACVDGHWRTISGRRVLD